MHTPVARTLADWTPLTAFDRDLYDDYVAFSADPATTLRETSPAEHLTASAMVFDDELTHVLLCFHRKGRFWVQFGGHIEPGDASLFAAAEREGIEESGVRELTPFSLAPVDLNRHALAAAFGTCRVHWDVGFAFTAPRAAKIVTSDESDDVAWWPVDALPDGAVDGLDTRLARAIASLTTLRAAD